ncbi:MAG: aminoglycoside phosphotransferase family protein [Mogibacterium sp.]|nr:aminoglycoside phosphotransferase family protein [Mogibacterium sp.]
MAENTIIEKLIADSEYRNALNLPSEITEVYTLLAQGEYNVNYLFAHPETGRKLVLRVNMGSQMHLDRQIEYEAHALSILRKSGRTPEVYYVDDSMRNLNHGILVMNYLPGRYPVYVNTGDMGAVMECMADIHSVEIPFEEVIYGEPFGDERVPADTVKLIAPQSSASSILDECELMAATYMDSDFSDKTVKRRLRLLLDKGHELAGNLTDNTEFRRCCINTELNSTNFLVDDEGFARLVDWEKPLYGDPAQDLGHLLAPTTTFWKTDNVFSTDETERLIDVYLEAVGKRFDTAGIRERTKALINITCLRGLTWCAMAWVEYQNPDKLIANESTRKKLDDYLSDSFLRDIETRLSL